MKNKKFVMILAIAGIVVATAAFAQVYPDGMVSYWKFEEGVGTTAHDSVNGNDGTLYNGPQWTSGIVGGALSFDGVNDYVQGPQPTWPIGTVEAWVKLNSYPTNFRYGIVAGNAYPKPGCRFSEILEVQPDGTASYYFWDGSLPVKRPTGTTILNLDEWYHLVVTVAVTDSEYEIILYVNGKKEGSATGQGIAAREQYFYFSYGLNCWNWDTFCHDNFDGVLDEVAVYDRALTPEEIEQHYQNGLNGQGYEEPPPPRPEATVDMVIQAVKFNLVDGKWEIKASIDTADSDFEQLVFDPQFRVLLEFQTGGTNEDPEFGIVAEDQVQLNTSDDGLKLEFKR